MATKIKNRKPCSVKQEILDDISQLSPKNSPPIPTDGPDHLNEDEELEAEMVNFAENNFFGYQISPFINYLADDDLDEDAIQ